MDVLAFVPLKGSKASNWMQSKRNPYEQLNLYPILDLFVDFMIFYDLDSDRQVFPNNIWQGTEKYQFQHCYVSINEHHTAGMMLFLVNHLQDLSGFLASTNWVKWAIQKQECACKQSLQILLLDKVLLQQGRHLMIQSQRRRSAVPAQTQRS